MRSHDLQLEFSPEFPINFNPHDHPILALHWFGILVLPCPDDAGALEAVDEDQAA